MIYQKRKKNLFYKRFGMDGGNKMEHEEKKKGKLLSRHCVWHEGSTIGRKKRLTLCLVGEKEGKREEGKIISFHHFLHLVMKLQGI